MCTGISDIANYWLIIRMPSFRFLFPVSNSGTLIKPVTSSCSHHAARLCIHLCVRINRKYGSGIATLCFGTLSYHLHHRLMMTSILLRLTCFLGFLRLIYAVPTMQAIRDEARLDDGTLSVAAFVHY